MGYSLFWLAVKGKALPDLLAQFELALTGETEEIPESDIASAELPSGWNLILWNDGPPPPEAQFAGASSNGQSIFYFVEEHVMSSLCDSWKDGSLAWSVRHNATWKNGHVYEGESLAIDGQPRDPFPTIRARLEAEQKEHNKTKQPIEHQVDFVFDIPVDLAEALTGFRHDKDVPGVIFNRLGSVNSAQKSKASFFRRIFQK
jgi:hypothetical protein